jgi:hypothetical protein
MTSTIPSSKRFRDYANVCSEFLATPMNHSIYRAQHYARGEVPPFQAYFDKIYLLFTTPEEQHKSLAFLHESLLPEYRKIRSELESCLANQFEDVEKYWNEDSAFMAASHRLLKRGSKRPAPEIDRVKFPYEVDSLLSAVDLIVTRTQRSHRRQTLHSREQWDQMSAESRPVWKEPSANFCFDDIRKLVEVDIKWKQALAIVIANHLERASYKLTQKAKDTAKKLASLLSEFNAEIEKPEAKYLLSLGGSLVRLGAHNMADLKRLEGFLASESLMPALGYREDKHLLARTTAQEIMFANQWALNNERKDLAFILLGLSAFEEPLDIEQKTLERIWKKANANNSLIMDAVVTGGLHNRKYRAIKDTGKYQFSVPNIPNIYLQIQEPE